MGAKVTLAGPPTLIPRGIEALGCEVRYTLDDLARGRRRLRAADAARAHDREPSSRRCASTPPSTRSTAAACGPRQVLMHPGPVNRGVELSAEVVDSPQAVITEQVAAGVVVRMAVLYEVLAPRRAGDAATGTPRPRRSPPDGRTAARPRAGAHGRPARSAAPTCSTRAPGIDAPRDVLVRDGEIAEIGAPGSLERAGGRRGRRRRRPPPVPGFVDPHVHLRTPGQEHKEDLDTGTRAAAAGGFCAVLAMPNTDPVVDSAPLLRSLRDAAAPRGARSRSASWPSITRGLDGRELTEMAELRDDGRARLHRRRHARSSAPAMLRQALQYQRLCGGVLALHEEDPSLCGRRRDARGRGQRAARRRRHPVDQRVDDGRARRGDRRLRGRAASTSSTSARASRSQAVADAKARGVRITARPARTTSASPTRRCARSTRA